MRRLVIVLMLTMFILNGNLLLAKPLYDSASSMASMYSDQIARQIGDVITIVISELVSSEKTRQNKVGKEFSISGAKGTGLLDFIKDLGLAGKTNLNVNKSQKNTDKLYTTITARVVDIMPNGDLVIEGNREVIVDNEKQMAVIKGVVRPRDLNANNSVDSTKIANLTIETRSLGRKPGIITKVLRFLF